MPSVTPPPLLSLRRYGPSKGSHRHDHFQVLWSLSGELELEVEGHGLWLPAGQGRVIAPGDRHDFCALRGSECLVLDTAHPEWATRQTPPDDPQRTHLLALSLARALRSGVAFSSEMGAALLAQLWGPADAATPRQRPIDWPALTRWVVARLHAPLTTADLAHRVGLSPSQLRARFAAEQRCSPMEWLRRLRLDKAQALRAQGLAPAEAARRTGYGTAATLAAARRRGQRSRDTGV